ncbi:MAG: glycosyltransferase [Oscillospiraceae bacterium]|jgi:glycosyltransferase involved in cell wall biosynthesis|nr:glycosyltransferase [Oscillospiraceae bacterium]
MPTARSAQALREFIFSAYIVAHDIDRSLPVLPPFTYSAQGLPAAGGVYRRRPRAVYACANLRDHWEPNHLLKDCGFLPLAMQREYGLRAVMAGFFFDGDYDTPLAAAPGLELEFYQLWDERLPFPFSDITDPYERAMFGYLWYNARQMDILFLDGCYDITPRYIKAYRELRPDGAVLLALDMNSRWMTWFPFEDSAYREAFDLCDAVVTCTKAIADSINNDPRASFVCHWLPNGFLDPAASQEEYNASMQAPPDLSVKENILLAVGRVGTAQKNTELLLEAFTLTAPDFPDWQLRIVGSLRQALPQFKAFMRDWMADHKHLIRDKRVVFTKEITDRQTLYAEYKKAKVFCLTSRFESTPNAFAEAARFGLFTVCTDIDCSREITDEGRLGIVCSPEDVYSCAAALREAMGGRADNVAAEAYHSRYTANYDYRRIARKAWALLFGLG